MVRDVAGEILGLIGRNDGVDKDVVYGNSSLEIQKIVEIILGECRCSFTDKNGNYIRLGSSTDIRVVQYLIQVFVSNLTQIPAEIVSMAMIKEETIGPFLNLNFEKKYCNENGQYEIELEKVFPDEFYINIFEKNLELKNKFISEVVKPYVKDIIFSEEKLMQKSPIGAFINKLMYTPKTREELIVSLKNMLGQVLNCDENLVENIASYMLVNIMNNKYFKNELINKTLDTTELQKLGKVYTGFGSLVESMINETVRMIELKSFPYGEYISIKNTFYIVIAVLIGLNSKFEELDSGHILRKIEEVNKEFSRADKKKGDSNLIYRSSELNSDKYGDSLRFVACKDLSKAMENLCELIKFLLEKKEELSQEEYVKEVFRIHYRILRISPFETANGRTARAIVNMLLQEKNMICIFRKTKRREYVEYIKECHRLISENEDKYVEGLVQNSTQCFEWENEFLNEGVPFLIVKS